MKKRIKVALVKPPIFGHHIRGTGVYSRYLYNALRRNNKVEVSLLQIGGKINNFDIIHYPYFDPFFLTLPIVKKIPTVVTVHDLIPLKFPKYFHRGIKGEIKWLIQKYSLSKTTGIITDSKASKEDILNFLHIEEDKIYVIYLGVEDSFRVVKSMDKLKLIKKKYKLPQDFILNVGDVNYNKNIPGLIRAFSLVCKQLSNLHLVLVGRGFVEGSTQSREADRLIDRLNLKDRILKLGHIELTDLIALYNLAQVYVQPSFAEGFGLPVIEAMACSTPVIASNISSLPEIVGDAGELVDPYSTEDIAKGIIKVVGFDTTVYQSKVKKGYEQANKFTWEKCVKETINVYKDLIT